MQQNERSQRIQASIVKSVEQLRLDSRFSDIADLVGKLSVDTTVQPLSQGELKLATYQPWTETLSDIPTNILSPNIIETLQELAVAIVNTYMELEASDKLGHKQLYDVAHLSYPLFSQDPSTVVLGFELQEYADYFDGMSSDERITFAREELLAKWATAGLFRKPGTL